MVKTLKEISEELGLSIATVSRVVNNKANVNEATRQLVQDTLDKYEYAPNLIARELKTQTSRTVGIIIPDITEGFFGNVIRSASLSLQNAGYGVFLCNSDETLERETDYLRLLIRQRVSGLIVASIASDSRSIDKLREFGIPVILIDNLFCDESSYDAVLIDNVRAGYLGCAHLLKKGCRRIGIIAGNQKEYTGRKRLEGCRNAFRDYGAADPEPYIRCGDFKEGSGYHNMLDLLASCPELDAVFIHSSKMTFGAIKALRESGKLYPRDLSLVSFDLWDLYSSYTPSITSVVQPELDIGTKAARLLLERMEGSRGEPRIQ